MKTRESGMPEEMLWESFFDPETTLNVLNLTPERRRVLDFGCGYGTFSIPAAGRVAGELVGFDIDPEMVTHCRLRAERAGLGNARFEVRDFVANGTGLEDGGADYVMLFNLLHAEDPHSLLREAKRNLLPGGILAVTHWKYDAATPRGPSMEIRPSPAECRRWMEVAGFGGVRGPFDLPPWHYGFYALAA